LDAVGLFEEFGNGRDRLAGQCNHREHLYLKMARVDERVTNGYLPLVDSLIWVPQILQTVLRPPCPTGGESRRDVWEH
jgi:hypothetical protein